MILCYHTKVPLSSDSAAMLCFLYFQYKLERYALRFCEISFATLFLNLKKLHTTGAMRKCFVRFTLTQQQVLRQIRFFDVRIDSLDGRTCALQLDNEHFQKHPVNGLIQKTICLPVTAIFCNKQFLRNVRVTSTCKSMDEALVRELFKISSLCKITKARFFSVLALKVVHSLFKDCFQFVLADNGEKLPLRTDVKFFKFPKALL